MECKTLTGAVIHEGEAAEAPTTCKLVMDEVHGPALIGTRRHRRQRLHPWTLANSALLDLPGLDLEYPLYRVFVHARQPCHGVAPQTAVTTGLR